MKLKKLKLKNFAQFTDFECEFGNQITHLVGVNGSGKTMIGITAIWACMKGIAERTKDGLVGERFRFIGSSGKSSDIQITVYDEKTKNEVVIKNHITQQGNHITCEPVQNERWLSELLSVAFLSARNFCQVDSKEQAILLGIDTKKYDQEIKSLKEEFTLINREIKSYGNLEKVEETEAVDVSKLVLAKDILEEKYYDKQREIDTHNREALQMNESRIKCNDKISDLKEHLAKCEKWLIDNTKMIIVKDVEKPNINIIKEQINNAQETNLSAGKYQNYLLAKERKETKENELDDNKIRQNKIQDGRLRYIQSFKFGFDGLEVDFEGRLLLNGRPIKSQYFSKGELELIVAKLFISQNPKLTLRFIDDFELLDEDNQIKIVDDLLSQGFQIITAEVGNKKVKSNTILLRECKIVEKYDNKKKLW